MEMENEARLLLSQKLYESSCSKDNSREGLYPIKYIAEKLACEARNPEQQLSAIYELFEILAETEEMNYFRCGFVQRLI